MKNKHFITLIITAILILIYIPSQAISSDVFSVNCDKITGGITVTGESDKDGFEYMGIMITKHDVNNDQLTESGMGANVIAMAQAVTENGRFSAVMKLPSQYETGEYNAFITPTSGSTICINFQYYNPNDRAIALNKLNSYTQQESQNFISCIEDAMDIFELTPAYYASNGFDRQELARVMIEIRPENGYASIEQFNKVFYSVEYLIILNSIEKADEVTEFIGKNYEKLGTDVRFNSLKTNVKKIISGQILTADTTTPEKLNALLAEQMPLISFKQAEYWNYYEDYLSLFGDSFALGSDYRKKLSAVSIESVCKGMYLSRSKYESVADIYDDYKAVIDSLYKEKNTSHSTGSGSSGGKSGGVSYPAAYADTEQSQSVDNTASFADLDGYKWAKEAIEGLQKDGVVSGFGNGEFRPYAYVTREEFVKMLCGAFDIKDETASPDFDDVPANAWYYPWIKKAFSGGIVNGIEENNFGTGKNVTRQDLATMAFRAAKLKGTTLEGGELDFSDNSEISAYAYQAVAALVKSGIVSGTDANKFEPLSFATRAETAKILYLLRSK